jgi:cytochrome c-type biogenesis protein CcmF
MRRLSLSYWGMVLAHLGVAVFVVGVSWVKTFETETDAVLKPGETSEIGPWRVTFIGVDSVQRQNHVAALGVFELTRGDGTVIHLLEPEKRRYQSSEQIMTEAAIHSDWFSDVYVGLGDAVQSSSNVGAWGVRLYYKPLINLIWWGCALMALGGLVTVFDRRYRPRKNAVAA